MERHLSECPGLEEDHEWELPGEHPERYLPECPGPEEGLEWKLSECPGHPERHLPECGVKSLNRVIVVNRYIDISFQGSRLCQEYHPEKNQSFLILLHWGWKDGVDLALHPITRNILKITVW